MPEPICSHCGMPGADPCTCCGETEREAALGRAVERLEATGDSFSIQRFSFGWRVHLARDGGHAALKDTLADAVETVLAEMETR